MKFCDKLIYLRKQKGLSQEDLAEILDVSRQTIYKWESGTNMPDIPKLQKLVLIFNVSFNYLLDEKLDIPEIKANTSSESKKITFRDVFVSKSKLKFEQSDHEHGYISNRKRRDKFFEEKMNSVKNKLLNKGYTNIIFPQKDLCLCYFEDQLNKSFGIYYNNAERFVCPFENYIDFQVTNTGYELNYNNAALVGVGVGVGAGGVAIGSMPQPGFNRPYQFFLSINYFDKEGNHKEYKLDLHTYRKYTTYNCKTRQEFLFLSDCLSRDTEQGLNNIIGKLKGIKAQAELVKQGEAKLSEIDINYFRQQAIEGEKLFLEEEKRAKELNTKYAIRKNTIIASIVGGVCIIIISLFISCAQMLGL